jgi:hypothetical protein
MIPGTGFVKAFPPAATLLHFLERHLRQLPRRVPPARRPGRDRTGRRHERRAYATEEERIGERDDAN